VVSIRLLAALAGYSTSGAVAFTETRAEVLLFLGVRFVARSFRARNSDAPHPVVRYGPRAGTYRSMLGDQSPPRHTIQRTELIL